MKEVEAWGGGVLRYFTACAALRQNVSPPLSIHINDGCSGAHRGRFWCAPFYALVRTAAGFGAHHFMLWCAPQQVLLRTKASPTLRHYATLSITL